MKIIYTLDLEKVCREVEKSTRVFYIYALCEPEEPWNIRYIGRTTRSLGTRLSGHIYHARLKQGSHKEKWIRMLLRKGQKPLIRLIDVGNEDTWIALEQFYIASYRAAGFKLTNATSGGDGVPGYTMSLEVSAKHSAVQKGRKHSAEQISRMVLSRAGFKHTPETKAKISEGCKGIKHSPESIERVAAQNRGRKHTPEARAKMSATRKEQCRKRKQGLL